MIVAPERDVPGISASAGFDHLAEEQADDGQRHESDQHIERKTLRRRLAWQAAYDFGDLCPVFPDHGQNGARLDDDLEQLAARVIEIEQVTGKDQMPRRGNRQEFGQPLNDAEDKGFEQQQKVHEALSEKGAF